MFCCFCVPPDRNVEIVEAKCVLMPRRASGDENIVPMINVVFLLLIFFLMTAQIAPLPNYHHADRNGDAPAGQNIVFMSAHLVSHLI